MSFGGGGSGGGSLSTDSDVLLSNPADGQVLGYSGSSSKWTNQTVATGGSGVPGAIYFDTYFSGANDNAKIASMNTYHAGLAANVAHPVVLFDTRQYNFSTSIVLYSGMKLQGGGQGSAREFGTGTIFNWQGASGTSLFTFPGSQTGQGYPSDGSPRDINISFIQMNGGTSVDCVQKFDPAAGNTYTAHTLWNTEFHGCGWVGWNTIWWGYGDGASITGVTHVQAVSNTPFAIGGSENSIFTDDGYSFADSGLSGWMSAGLPFMRSLMSKSTIGKMMFSARGNSYQIKVETGSNLVLDGGACDAPDSAPTYGSGIQITGGTAITITNWSFKGMMTNPSGAAGGTSGNKGWINVTGGSQITVQGCNFQRAGNNQPAESVPLIYTSSSVAQGAVKWGYNNYSNFTANATLQQAASGQIINVTDPKVTLNTAA